MKLDDLRKVEMHVSNPPLSPRETLPTMYDLPSEDQEEPGVPDEFHNFQPELLLNSKLIWVVRPAGSIPSARAV